MFHSGCSGGGEAKIAEGAIPCTLGYVDETCSTSSCLLRGQAVLPRHSVLPDTNWQYLSGLPDNYLPSQV